MLLLPSLIEEDGGRKKQGRGKWDGGRGREEGEGKGREEGKRKDDEIAAIIIIMTISASAPPLASAASGTFWNQIASIRVCRRHAISRDEMVIGDGEAGRVLVGREMKNGKEWMGLPHYWNDLCFSSLSRKRSLCV